MPKRHQKGSRRRCAGSVPVSSTFDRRSSIYFSLASAAFLLVALCGCEPKPDLVVRTLDKLGPSAPFPPLTDRPASFYALVTNIGNAPVKDSFSISLELDGQQVETWQFPSAAEIEDYGPGKQVVLEPGGSRLYSYVVPKPAAGEYKLRWTADSGDAVDEAQEGPQSNQLELTVDVQAPPDLVVDITPPNTPSLGVGPYTVEQTEWNVTITNQGFGKAHGPFVTLFDSSPKSGFAPTLLFPEDKFLEKDESHTFKVKQLYTKPGSVTVSATVDYHGNVTENQFGGETNNKTQKTYPVKSVDLDVYALQVYPPQPTTNDTIEIRFTLRNKGGMHATNPFNVGVLVTDQPAAGYGISEVLTAKPHPAGMSVQMIHPVSLKKAGQYEVRVVADASVIGPQVKGEQYYEVDEVNNSRQTTLTVEPAPVEDPPPPTCEPGKGKFKLNKQSEMCQSSGVHPYWGAIPNIQDGVLFKITNNTTKWQVDIIDGFNALGQGGGFTCQNHGPKCDYQKINVVAPLATGQSWSNITFPDLTFGRRITACLKDVVHGAAGFPNTVELEYEYTCK